MLGTMNQLLSSPISLELPADLGGYMGCGSNKTITKAASSIAGLFLRTSYHVASA
jgi:hypothetical protein